MLLLLLLFAPILAFMLLINHLDGKEYPCGHCRAWQDGGTLQASRVFAATFVAKSEAEYWSHMREKHAYKGTNR